ncbi:MAG: transketolase, partial [candidate division WS1 bacterium]|nr:transketolase [candidate division WS1 bacterium]
MDRIDELCINTIRGLAMDAVEKANSGHPGMPMGAAPMGYLIYQRFMRHNPQNPLWFDRDRFLLSAGHGSMLLYSLLHLTGYNLPMEELMNFRQWESRTPGHPEYDHTPGVETTTGPLGQGFANGIGLAIAEAFLAEKFNCPDGGEDFQLVDHYTYVICSDGDLMEGISHEAASLAGHLGLGKLIYLYDDNHISIEGSTDLAFSEEVPQRFESYGWHVQSVADGNDINAIAEAIENAQAETKRPSIICVRTHIGYGSPMQDDSESHGAPLGEENIRAAKEYYGMPVDEKFYVPDEVRKHMERAVERGQKAEREWKQRLARYRERFPEQAAIFDRSIAGDLPQDWDVDLPVFTAEDGKIATRSASGKVLNAIKDHLPTLIGGSADLAPSTKTLLDGEGAFCLDNCGGRNMHFGVREHAMGAIVNGMALHGGVIPYGATFLVFADYMRPALRLSAIMSADAHWVFTHDSIGVGEDGPTHQPIEHVMSLRAIPDLAVIRPADANETAIAWKLAIERQSPVALALTRQNLPILDPAQYPVREGAMKGAYVLANAEGDLQLVLIATGSEVALALEAREALQAEGIGTRVVSMPCMEIFEEQPSHYINEVLPIDTPKVSIEAGVTLGWERWTGCSANCIGIDRFGASA